MSKIYYPAIFHPEEIGYSVNVPDLDGCFTQGDTLEQAFEMAQDAIGLYLEGESTIYASSRPENLVTQPKDFVVLVAFDQTEYTRKQNSKSVKKTLTIPFWLNSVAEENHINFSGVLQSALKQQLHIE